MPSPVHIRPYEEADRPFLRTLYLASRRHTWTWLEDDFRLEDFDRAVIGETILVAERDGYRLGFASIFTQENFLHNLFIDPQFQGTGAGSALLLAAQAMFTRQGSLKCLVKSKNSVGFYLSKGWIIVSEGKALRENIIYFIRQMNSLGENY